MNAGSVIPSQLPFGGLSISFVPRVHCLVGVLHFLGRREGTAAATSEE